MAQGRKKVFIIWSLFVGLLALSCYLVAVQVSRGYEQTCALLRKAPRSDLTHIKNIPDENLTAQANLVAYLKYEPEHFPPERGDEFTYLGLTLEWITHQSPWLRFSANCAKLSILLEYEPEIVSYEVKFIYISTRKEPLDEHFLDLCYVAPQNIVFQRDFRYACHQTIQYPCIKDYEGADGSRQSKIIAWFVVDNLEIELGGSADDYRQAKFSKHEQLCQNDRQNNTTE